MLCIPYFYDPSLISVKAKERPSQRLTLDRTPPVLLVLPAPVASICHPLIGLGLITSGRGIRAGEHHCTAGECGISHVLPGDQWLAAVTPHQGRPCHLLPTDRCSPNSRPALLWRVSGLACGYFCTQPPTHALVVGPGDAAAASQCWLLGHSRAKRDRRR